MTVDIACLTVESRSMTGSTHRYECLAFKTSDILTSDSRRCTDSSFFSSCSVTSLRAAGDDNSSRVILDSSSRWVENSSLLVLAGFGCPSLLGLLRSDELKILSDIGERKRFAFVKVDNRFIILMVKTGRILTKHPPNCRPLERRGTCTHGVTKSTFRCHRFHIGNNEKCQRHSSSVDLEKNEKQK